MLFRYKIEKSREYICSGVSLIRYAVKIQKYYKNNIFFQWTTYEDTTLKSIVGLMDDTYCFDSWDNALPEIAKTISKYGSVDKMISEYIYKFIIKEMELVDEMGNIEKSIDDIVLTNEWKTIEFKENK